MSTNIRCSMLPSYSDCARRAAAKQYRTEIVAAGYELNELEPAVGAALGTSVHSGAAMLLQEKKDTGEVLGEDEATEFAVSQFADNIRDGATWDETTPNVATAHFQIRRLVASYADLARQVEPALIEYPMRVDAGDGFELTGTLDLVTRPRQLRDLKSGALARPYQAQLGAYSLLLKSNKVNVSEALIDWLPRAPKTQPQPGVETQQFSVSTCERAAHATIQFIKRDLSRFRSTGDPWSFAANPMSMVCTRRYCPAHGTKFCDMPLPTSEE
ncbi:MAG: PD-(D/E)XK nuclease family protein [Bradyrhizobium sp.]